MAVIPMGNFGQASVVPRTSPSRVDTSGSDAAGRAYERLGQTGIGVSAQMLQGQQQKQAEAEAQEAALTRVRAANATAENQLQTRAIVNDLADQARRGLDYTELDGQFEERMGALEVPTIQGLRGPSAEAFDGAIKQNRMAGRLSLDGVIVGARRDAGQAQLATFIDTLGKSAGAPGADIESIHRQARGALPLLQQFGLDGSMLEKTFQEFEDRNWTNQAAQRFNDGSNDPAALRQLQTDLTAEDGAYFGKLDSEKRNVLGARVGNRIDLLEAKAEAKADKTVAIATRTLDEIDRQNVTGIPATLEMRASQLTVMQAAGPEFVEAFKQREVAETQVQAMLRLPIADQERAVAETQARLMRDGGSPADIANAARVSAAVKANVAMLREDPLQFASARLDEDITPIDLSGMADPNKASAIAATLSQRSDTLAMLRGQYGAQVPNALLLPSEVDGAVAVLNEIRPEQAAQVFGALRQAAGSASAYEAVMRQIAPGTPLKARAGELMVKPKGKLVAELMLRGDALLQAKGFKMPDEKGFRAQFNGLVGNAYQGREGDYERDLGAARAVYAGSLSRDGQFDGLEEIDTRRLRESIRDAVGQPSLGFGRAVLPPWGMDPVEFEDRAWPLAEAAMTAAGKEGFPFELVRTDVEGVYVLSQGRTPLLHPTRRTASGDPAPIRINLNGSSMPKPARRKRDGYLEFDTL